MNNCPFLSVSLHVRNVRCKFSFTLYTCQRYPRWLKTENDKHWHVIHLLWPRNAQCAAPGARAGASQTLAWPGPIVEKPKTVFWWQVSTAHAALDQDLPVSTRQMLDTDLSVGAHLHSSCRNDVQRMMRANVKVMGQTDCCVWKVNFDRDNEWGLPSWSWHSRKRYIHMVSHGEILTSWCLTEQF